MKRVVSENECVAIQLLFHWRRLACSFFSSGSVGNIKKMTIVRKGRLTNINFSVQLIVGACAFVGKRRGHVYVHKMIVSNLWHYGEGSWDMKLRIGKHPRALPTVKFQSNNTRNIIWTENCIISWQNITSCSLISCHDFSSRVQLLLKESFNWFHWTFHFYFAINWSTTGAWSLKNFSLFREKIRTQY